MRTIAPWTLAALICVLPAASAQKPTAPKPAAPKPAAPKPAAPKPAAPKPAATKPKPLTTAQLKAQVQQLAEERDDLKDRLAATEDLQQELADARKGRELARQESEGLRRELTELKAYMTENQSGSDAILQELRKAKSDLAACQDERMTLQKGLEEANAKAKTVDPTADTLAAITPARPLNLNRVTPKVRNVNQGVVVVNVLVSDNGEVLDSRLVQGLPGNNVDIQKANEACVEAAKRLVFDPARSSDGKTKLRVWQAVGFLMD